MHLYKRLGRSFMVALMIVYSYVSILSILKLLKSRDWNISGYNPQHSRLPLLNTELREFCNLSAIDRGFNQRVITVSVFGPKENTLFQPKLSLLFLEDLIQDVRRIYPGWILRVYYDDTIAKQDLRDLQCRYNHIDFYDMTGRSFPPPRMWRFLTIGDALVDISKYKHIYRI